MLSDRVVVITGGAGLIGKELVKAVVKNNGTAIIADINEKVGMKVKDDLSKQLGSSRIDFVHLDITCKSSLQKCIKHLEEINFFKPKEKKPKMLENLRSIFYKMDLSEKETRILSSVFASLAKKKAD